MVDIPATAEAENNLTVPYDAGDSEQVNKQRKKVGRNRRARLLFVEAIMEQPEGRKYMFDLLEKCSIFGNPLIQGDTHATYFRLGEQNIGKMVLQDIQEFSELYCQMMNENKNGR